MKVIVAQLGSRRNYAVPRMLEAQGVLEALYTDACAQSGLGSIIDSLFSFVPNRYIPGAFKGLSQRQVRGVPSHKIHTFDRLLLDQLSQSLYHQNNHKYYAKVNKHFAEEMIREGVGNASMVYSMFGEGFDFLEYAKSLGLKIAIDIYLNPIMHRIMYIEQKNYPDWEDPSQWNPKNYREDETRIQQLIQMADLLLCPSESVVDGLKYYSDHIDSKLRIVPYGSGIDYGMKINDPIRGRVLFAGSAVLNKGIYYFAEAANICAANGKSYVFRVAGSTLGRI